MATFTFNPSYTPTQRSQPRIRKSQFTDGGYEHRLRFGLNTNPKEWNLSFDNRTDAERDQILAFFDERGGSESFDWTGTLTDKRNLLFRTEDYARPLWTKSDVTIGEGLAGNLGGTNAYSIIPNTSNTIHYLQQTITVASTTSEVTTSALVKAATGRDIYLRAYSGANFHGVNFNTSTGIGSLATGGGVHTTTDWGATRFGAEGWWTLYVKGRPSNSTTRTLRIAATSAGGAETFAGDGSTAHAIFMGPQMEYGNLTSYQPILEGAVTAKWVCEQWDWDAKSCNNNTITAVFRQVYEN